MVLNEVNKADVVELWFIIQMSLASVRSNRKLSEDAFNTIPYVRHHLGKNVNKYCDYLTALAPDQFPECDFPWEDEEFDVEQMNNEEIDELGICWRLIPCGVALQPTPHLSQ